MTQCNNRWKMDSLNDPPDNPDEITIPAGVSVECCDGQLIVDDGVSRIYYDVDGTDVKINEDGTYLFERDGCRPDLILPAGTFASNAALEQCICANKDLESKLLSLEGSQTANSLTGGGITLTANGIVLIHE